MRHGARRAKHHRGTRRDCWQKDKTRESSSSPSPSRSGEELETTKNRYQSISDLSRENLFFIDVIEQSSCALQLFIFSIVFNLLWQDFDLIRFVNFPECDMIST